MSCYTPTVFGNHVDLLNPKAETISLLDISVGLGKINRYLGQFEAEHYCVAEHCIIMARQAPPEQAIHFLLHDAAEYVMGDITHPIKELFKEIYVIESKILAVIYESLEIDLPSDEVAAMVHEYDMRMRATEKLLLNIDPGVVWPEIVGLDAFDCTLPCWSAAEAANEWMTYFLELHRENILNRKSYYFESAAVTK
jgi:hypothetical protein